MKSTLTALMVAASLIASSASAFDPDDLQKLKDTGDCMDCDLSNANFRRIDLSNANLALANLSGADLNNANLRNANLSIANLSGADLKRTLMNGAILCNTIMPDGSVTYSGC